MEVLDRAFAAAYEHLSPALERGRIGTLRRQLLRGVGGHVLDVGAGVGANLPHLGTEVQRVTLLEPSPPMARRLRAVAQRTAGLPETETIEAPGEALPLSDGSVDAVIFTLVLCTVDDPELTLAEARRVLRPDGRLVLIEHVRSDGALLGRLQEAIRPVWSFLGGGCDPTRDTHRTVEQAGFDTSRVRSLKLTGFGPTSPAIAGIATRA